jgi:hypothetical protein
MRRFIDHRKGNSIKAKGGSSRVVLKWRSRRTGFRPEQEIENVTKLPSKRRLKAS